METQDICSTPLSNKNWDIIIGAKRGGHFSLLKNRTGAIGEVEYQEVVDLLQDYRGKLLVLEGEYTTIHPSSSYIIIKSTSKLEFAPEQDIQILISGTGDTTYLPIKAKNWKTEYNGAWIKNPSSQNDEDKNIQIKSSKLIGQDANYSS